MVIIQPSILKSTYIEVSMAAWLILIIIIFNLNQMIFPSYFLFLNFAIDTRVSRE